MQVFLETRRLVLRRFTMADVDNLVSLDADPDVMHFVTGGIPTARDEIENELLPGFLDYYEQFEGTASGRPSRRRPGNSWGGSTSGRARRPARMRPNSATGCTNRRGARDTPPRGHAR
jgi:Acetyltransferases, including N-acetylases of ribosomal proteins